MTKDALLAIALNVAIPFGLALAGGILAAKALPEDNQTQRSRWIALFVFLFVMGVVLAFAQQIILADKQKRSDEKQAATENALRGDNRETQGQLESINKVLSSFIAQGGLSSQSVAFLSALAGQAAKASASVATSNVSGKTYPANLSNSELKTEAMKLVKAMRDFIADYGIQSTNLFQRYSSLSRQAFPGGKEITDEQKKRLAELQSMESSEYNRLSQNTVGDWEARFKVEAKLLRDELLARMPRDERFSEDSVRAAPKYEAINGNSFLMKEVPDDLERLAKKLN